MSGLPPIHERDYRDGPDWPTTPELASAERAYYSGPRKLDYE